RILLRRGGLATSSTGVRRWRRGGGELHHLNAPAAGSASRSPRGDGSVAPGTCPAAGRAPEAGALAGGPRPRGVPRGGRFVGRDGRVVVTRAWPGVSERVAA